jgi:DNA polymerase-3 subunit epsilon
VQNAPPFEDVAHDIYHLLNNKIFVAHNVNFDHSFVRYHLAVAGYELQCNKLCTVRLGRKIIPGLPSYSLGKLCRTLGIDNESRHRAAGDAEATSQLFSLLLQKDTSNHIPQALKQHSKEQRREGKSYLHRQSEKPKKTGKQPFFRQQPRPAAAGVFKKYLSHHFPALRHRINCIRSRGSRNKAALAQVQSLVKTI